MVASRTLGFFSLVAVCAGLILAADPPGNPPSTPEGKPAARFDLYGDPLPEGVLCRMGTERLRHPNGVIQVALAPDGKTLASAGCDGTVRVWETESGRLLRTLVADSRVVRRVAFVKDGKELISAGVDGVARCWDAASGKELRQVAFNPRTLLWVGVSPDGKYVAGSDTTTCSVIVWDTETGKEVWQLKGPTKHAVAVTFSQDRRILATSDEPDVWLWDLSTGKELGRLRGHQGSVYSLAFAPDGKTLVSWGADKTMRLWSVAEAKEVRQFEGPFQHSVIVAFTPDGRHVVTGGQDGFTRVWDVAKGSQLRNFEDGVLWKQSMTLSGDGKLVASSGTMDRPMRVHVLETGKELAGGNAPGEGLGNVAFSPDGKTLASAGTIGTVRLWDAATGKEVGACEGHLKSPQPGLTFSPDGTMLHATSNDGVAHVWNAATRKLDRKMAASPNPGAGWSVLSPDGKSLATACGEKVVSLRDAMTGAEIRRWEEHEGQVRCLAFSPDGKWLACGCWQPSWLVRKGQDKNTKPAFAAVHLWDVQTGLSLGTLNGHPGNESPSNFITSMAFSPDGRLLATAGYYDRTVRVWELVTRKERRALPIPKGSPDRVVFSPEGRLLAVAGTDNDMALVIYDLFDQEPLWRSEGRLGAFMSLAFLPDSRRLAAGGGNTAVLVWDVETLTRAAARNGEPLADEKLDDRWKDLASDDAPAAHRAMGELLSRPEQAVKLLAGRLKADAIDPEQQRRIDGWVRDLDSDEFRTREDATARLKDAGVLALPTLLAERDRTASVEVRTRLRTIVEALEKAEKPRAELRTLRGLEVLERVGTESAKQELARLAKGAAGLPVSEAARAALDRLADRARKSKN